MYLDYRFRGRFATPTQIVSNSILVQNTQPSFVFGETARTFQSDQASSTAPKIPTSKDLRPACGYAEYPSYLQVPDIHVSPYTELVKGTTCKLIMTFFSEGHSIRYIAELVRSQLRRDGVEERPYDTDDVKIIVQACKRLGFGSQTPLACDFESDAIEGWWLKEDSYCEQLRRQEPISKDVCGTDGWWSKREDR